MDKLVLPEATNDTLSLLSDTLLQTKQSLPSVKLQRGKPGYRHDRGISQFLFIPRRSWMFGIMASYKGYDSKDSQMFSFLKDFNFNGELMRFTPYVGYLLRDNMALGLKLGYQRVKGKLDNISLDMGEDLDFGISNLDYRDDMFNLTLFHRSYIGLDRSKRFGLFNETAISYNWGTNRFTQGEGTGKRNTETEVDELHIGINPGLCVFIMNNVSFEFSVGVVGFRYRTEKQLTNNEETGSWRKSGANFKINIFDINMGIIVYL